MHRNVCVKQLTFYTHVEDGTHMYDGKPNGGRASGVQIPCLLTLLLGGLNQTCRAAS